MILNKIQKTIDVDNSLETKKFSIQASAKAFKILSSSLYKNPIKAIIRELSCNAFDAHIQSGQTKPFEIHLPDSFDPVFQIRDFGTGISEENIYKIYTTYFASTKNDSNEFVGGLGLGSKTPFAYCDQFTVESFQNGIVEIWTAFINEKGCPSITKVLSTPTDEENGLCVQFPVKMDDFRKFQNEALEVFKWWSEKDLPIIKGTFDKYAYNNFRNNLEMFDQYALYKTNYYNGSTTVGTNYVVQGNIAYPIDLEWLYGKNVTLPIPPFVLFVDIGQIDFIPSREAIEENDANKKVLEKIIYEKMIKQKVDEIDENLSKAVSKYDLVVNFSEKVDHKWMKLDAYHQVVLTHFHKYHLSTFVNNYEVSLKDFKQSPIIFGKGEIYKELSLGIFDSKFWVINIASTQFISYDIDKGGLQKLKYAMSFHNSHYIVIKDTVENIQKELYKMTGGYAPKVHKISELIKDVVIEKKTSSKPKYEWFFDEKGSKNSLPFDKEFFYIPVTENGNHFYGTLRMENCWNKFKVMKQSKLFEEIFGDKHVVLAERKNVESIQKKFPNAKPAQEIVQIFLNKLSDEEKSFVNNNYLTYSTHEYFKEIYFKEKFKNYPLLLILKKNKAYVGDSLLAALVNQCDFKNFIDNDKEKVYKEQHEKASAEFDAKFSSTPFFAALKGWGLFSTHIDEIVELLKLKEKNV